MASFNFWYLGEGRKEEGGPGIRTDDLMIRGRSPWCFMLAYFIVYAPLISSYSQLLVHWRVCGDFPAHVASGDSEKEKGGG